MPVHEPKQPLQEVSIRAAPAATAQLLQALSLLSIIPERKLLLVLLHLSYCVQRLVEVLVEALAMQIGDVAHSANRQEPQARRELKAGVTSVLTTASILGALVRDLGEQAVELPLRQSIAVLEVPVRP
jgi:hypothetical protein